MIEVKDLLADLSSRLPELEWKIKKLGASFPVSRLPRGLFQNTPIDCIAEIKSDILALSRQKNPRVATYLASRLQQKINVLVVVCQLHQSKHKSQDKAPFVLTRLTTRQQWIQSLEQEVNALALQQQAMQRTVEQMKSGTDATLFLNAKKELGELEKQLTLAKEALSKAIA